jgi:hypothetical protein
MRDEHFLEYRRIVGGDDTSYCCLTSEPPPSVAIDELRPCGNQNANEKGAHSPP